MPYKRPQPGTVLRQILEPNRGIPQRRVTERDCRPHYARGDTEFAEDSYLSISPEDRAGTIEEWYEPSKQGEPTDAMPGTQEKIDVMEQRVRQGEAIHHPDDRNARKQ